MLCHHCGKLRLKSRVALSHQQTFKQTWSWSKQRYLHYGLHYRSPPAILEAATSGGLRRTHRNHATCLSASKWKQPEGYNSGIKVYHPIVKDKVPLILRQEKLAQWYACGPTVYDSTHIGHASSYVRLDIIRRIMGSVFDIDTTLVMGMTDIDDKIIKRASETHQDMSVMTKFYESEFFTDMANLNVSPPSVVTRVTEHIPQIINFIADIEKKGMAYKVADGSVFFDVKQYGKYGVFASHPDKMPEGESQKRSSQDFALWKASKPGEPLWESPWGKGRPGWHIECSAMASGIFGPNFDLHTGGEDLIFPHHENELAQSSVFHNNDQWVNYWIHTGHLYTAGQSDKMSKSLKNVVTVSEFLEDYTPNQFRMLCLLNNYKKRIEFSPERMDKAVTTMSSFNSVIKRCDSYVRGQIECRDIPEAELFEKLHTTRRAIEKAFADDFNTPQALGNLMRLVKYTNQLFVEKRDEGSTAASVRSNAPVAAVGFYVRRLLKQLGLDIGRKKAEEETETHLQFYKAVESVVSSRGKIREFAKDKKFMVQCAQDVGIPEKQAKQLMKSLYQPLWEASDKIRADILTSANVQINDGPESSSWSVVDTHKKPKKQEPADGNSKQEPADSNSNIVEGKQKEAENKS